MTLDGEIKMWFSAEGMGATIGGQSVSVADAIKEMERRTRLKEAIEQRRHDHEFQQRLRRDALRRLAGA